MSNVVVQFLVIIVMVSVRWWRSYILTIHYKLAQNRNKYFHMFRRTWKIKNIYCHGKNTLYEVIYTGYKNDISESWTLHIDLNEMFLDHSHLSHIFFAIFLKLKIWKKPAERILTTDVRYGRNSDQSTYNKETFPFNKHDKILKCALPF